MVVGNTKIHYAWIIAAAAFLTTGICTGLLVNCMGVFVKPVSSELGTGRSQFALSISICTLVSTLCYPLWGRYLKNGSVKGCYLVSAAVIPLIFVGYSVAREMWQFYCLSVLLGAVGASVTSLATSTLITRWFHEKRGLAMSIATCGSGIMPLFIIPFITSVIERWGWRTAYRTLAVIYLLLVLSCALLLIKDKPSDKGLAPYGSGMTGCAPSTMADSAGVTCANALRGRCFWFLAAAAFLGGFSFSGVNNNVQAYLTDLQFSAKSASLIAAYSMAAMSASKFLIGYVFDRRGFRACGLITMSGAFLTALCLIRPNSEFFALVYIPAFGLMATYPALCGAYGTMQMFGAREFSTINGLIMSMTYLGMTLGSFAVGLIYDRLGSYQYGWVLLAVLALLAVAAIVMANHFSPKTLK